MHLQDQSGSSQIDNNPNNASIEQLFKQINQDFQSKSNLSKEGANEYIPFRSNLIQNLNRIVHRKKSLNKNYLENLEEKFTAFRKKYHLDNDISDVSAINSHEASEIYTSNSGLVLLAPFFKHLFQELHYLDKGQFKNETNQARAIALSQYLFTGKEDANEFDLALNKILCGLNPSTVLGMNIQLTDIEKGNP